MQPIQAYGEPAGLRLLQALEQVAVDPFTAGKAATVGAGIGLTPPHVWTLLHHLTASGRLTRLKKGRYGLVDPATGALRAHSFAIGAALVTPSAVSHWSALQHWGLTEQIPSVVTLSTPARTRGGGSDGRTSHRPAWTVDGLRYEYVEIARQRYFGVEHVWFGERNRVPVFDRERALLDAFHHFHIFGSFTEALSIVEDHLSELDIERLVAYAVQIRIGAVAKRVGWSLGHLGVASEILEPLRTQITSSDVPLDPGLPRRGPHDPKWHVIANLGTVQDHPHAG
jgi:predicted transcriptional regulator of viral defense system